MTADLLKVIPKEDVEANKRRREMARFQDKQTAILSLSIAKSHTAPLIQLTDAVEFDKDTAEKIYTDVMRIAKKLSKKFGFSLT